VLGSGADSRKNYTVDLDSPPDAENLPLERNNVHPERYPVIILD
jgi:hypothetical protein